MKLRILLLTVIVATSCSGDDGEPSATSPSNPPTTTSSVTATTASPTGGGGGFVALCPGFEVPEEARAVVVERSASPGELEDVIAADFDALMAGLTPEERAAGLLVPWPEGADLLDAVTLDGDVLRVDFALETRDEYISAPGTSRPFFIPLVETAFRRDEVERVEFLLGGRARPWNAWWEGDASSHNRSDWRAQHAPPTTTCPPPAG